MLPFQVACISFLTLFLELLLSRIFMFSIGYTGAFFAIPLTLLGIAAGGLYHQTRGVRNKSSAAWIFAFIFYSLAGLIVIFWLNNALPPNASGLKIITLKSVFCGILFLPPFFISGVILSSLFRERSDNIGRLYYYDFLGGAAACAAVPVLMHFFDIAPVIGIFIGIAIVVWAVLSRQAAAAVSLAALLIFGIQSGAILRENPGTHGSVSLATKYSETEVYKKWNEFSRVALVRITDSLTGRFMWYKVVHDNGISNVAITSEKSIRKNISKKRIATFRSEYIPTAMGMKPENILVLFAGCGNDMIYLNELHGGRPDITGIELNPLVKSICSDNPFLKSYGLKEYYARPNIHLRVTEGRSYLQAHPEKKFDIIFVSRDGSSLSNLKQMFTAKYLQTADAYRQYAEHLSKDGIVIFGSDPYRQKRDSAQRIESLKYTHQMLGLHDFEKSVFVYRGFIVYKPSLFTESEMDGLKRAYGRQNSPYASRITEKSVDMNNVMTDNRPFRQPSGWNTLFDFRDKNPQKAVRNSLAAVLAVLGLLILAAYPVITRGQPQLLIREKIYFLLTGFAYMCLQIGLISRYDLFLGNPLYAMAIVITAFLAWNGLGSFVAHKIGGKINAGAAVACAFVLTPAMIILSNLCIKKGLALPLAAKIGITLASLLPIGFVLGMLFPLGVGMLNARKAANAVPAAYAFSALSSVLGSVYALFVLPGLGYNAVMFHAAPLYAAALLAFLPVFSQETL